jgi:hypothetical protein
MEAKDHSSTGLDRAIPQHHHITERRKTEAFRRLENPTEVTAPVARLAPGCVKVSATPAALCLRRSREEP